MAANSSSRGVVANLGKRFVAQIRSPHSKRSLSVLFYRSVHASVYDKNIDEHVRPAVVPDEVIQSQSDKYWGPHPQTGVFGPAGDHNPVLGSPAKGGSTESVLEQKAFFRALEDLDKPEHA